MKIHLAWMRFTAAAATIATFGGQFAAGQSQYGPYATAPQYSTVAPYGVQPYQPTQPTVYPTTTQPAAPPTNFRTADRPGYAPAQQPAYAPATQSPQSRPRYQSQYQSPQYQPPQYQPPAARPTYPSFAKQPTSTVTPGTTTPGSAAPQPSESLPTPDPAMSGDPAAQGYNSTSPYPSTDATNGYFASDPGRNLGANGYQDCGVDGYMEDCDDGSQWFGGVYGLYMTRSQPGYRRYTVGVDPPTNPYFPAAADTENESDCNFLVPDWREGIEVRLGCTFGVGDSCDYGDSGCGGYGEACGCEPGCNPCCQQMYAWEVAYWGIDREVQEQFVDGPVVGTFRYYGMINYAGLQYDDGGGAQPVNDYYNYQSPITGPGAETVLAQRVRTNFWAQNLELNFLRLPLYMGGCDYDCCAPAFTLTGLCGVRYFRMDDDFEFGTEWDDGSGPFNGFDHSSANELYHDIQMENNLVGLQLGANMNYCVAARWNVFWDTNFGLYNNYITHDQRLYNGLGLPVTFTQDGREATVNSDKNDVAFLGEMRIGGGYLFSNNWRGTIAYRAIGISGVALAPDQIKPEYSNWADTARINADGSIIIHGVQAGIECNF